MISEKMMQLGKKSSVIREIFEYGKKRKAEIGADNVFDFSLGNPSVPAPNEVNATIIDLVNTMNPISLHGYTSAPGDMNVRKAMADSVNRDYSTNCAKPEYIYMTCGAAASLTVSLNAIVNNGDEVIVLAPFFPEYRVFVEKAGAKLVVVENRKDNLQIDFQKLKESINEKTKAIIINSPNNPSGAIIPEEDIRKLSEILCNAEKTFSSQIFLISDEPYRKLVYGDSKVTFAGKYYSDTILCYSFSKALSLPGERIGYIMVSSEMDNANDVFAAVCGAGRALGFVCAPSMWQYVAEKCVDMTSDISVYAENRDIFCNELGKIGYEVIKPEGAFYLFMKSLEEDAYAFSERAKKYELLVVPSDDFGCKGFVRISYCVDTKTVEKSIPAFKALYEDYKNI